MGHNYDDDHINLIFIRYNARELGAYVGLQLLLKHLDPLSISTSKNRHYSNVDPALNDRSARFVLPTPPPKSELPEFRLPKSITASFPGGLNFTHCGLPTVPLDLQELITGEACSEKLTVLRVSDSLRSISSLSFIPFSNR
jgi:hypothetical protein